MVPDFRHQKGWEICFLFLKIITNLHPAYMFFRSLTHNVWCNGNSWIIYMYRYLSRFLGNYRISLWWGARSGLTKIWESTGNVIWGKRIKKEKIKESGNILTGKLNWHVKISTRRDRLLFNKACLRCQIFSHRGWENISGVAGRAD